VIRPTSVAELQAVLADEKPLWVCGLDTKRRFRAAPPPEATLVSMAGLAGVIAIHPEDQVAVAWAGTPLVEFQEALAEHGLRLPILGEWRMGGAGWHAAGMPGTLGGWLAMDMPHVWPGYGPRRLLLGATVLRGDGTIAKAGSQAVKSVAGYDIHKFLVGTRGTLALFLQIIVQALPLGGGPPLVEYESGVSNGPVEAILTTTPTGFADALARHASITVVRAPATQTLWLSGSALAGEGDRVVAATPVRDARAVWPGGARVPHAERKLMGMAKAAFDPERRFNPGELGL